MKRESDTALQKEYSDLCAAIGSAKEKELEKMISTINQIHRSLKRAAVKNIEDSDIKEKADELSECFSRFAHERAAYNDCISEVNHYITRQPQPWIAKLLQMEEYEKIDDLAIP